MSAPRWNVVMTAPVMAEPAERLLRDNGCAVHFMPPYPDAESVARLVAQTQADAILCRQGQVNDIVFAASPRLRIVARHGVGMDEVDVPVGRAAGVTLTNAPGSNTRQVAEHAVAMMLGIVKNLHGHSAAVASGEWRGAGGQVRDVAGLRLGLLGYGRIAREVTKLLAPWDMPVTAWDPYADAAAFTGITRVADVADLWPVSDILSIHIPRTANTNGMVDAAALAAMPKGAVVINTGRGGIVDEAALAAALDSGHISGAGLDVFDVEPPPADHPLRRHPKVLRTPHVAGVTPGSLVTMAVMAAECIVACLNGKPIPQDRVVFAGTR